MTYEQWDVIADSVNPLLAVATIVLPFLMPSNYRGGRVAFYATTLCSMAAMYALGWLDQTWGLWKTFELDFSTHSGFAAVLVLSMLLWDKAAGVIGGAVFIAYAVLMLYQQYHSVADILSTLLFVATLTFNLHELRLFLVHRRDVRRLHLEVSEERRTRITNVPPPQ